MKITAVHAQHFLGAPARPLSFRSPVVCIAGPNGVGKSSLIEAIRFCLIATAPREITLKGDYDQLLTFGAKKGAVSVTLDGTNTLVRDIKTGKLKAGDPIPEAIEEWLPALLDAHTFTRMETKPQRTFMFKLLGISMGWPVVKKELERENVPDQLIDVISAPILGGFDKAAEYAQGKATEFRAEWRAITGQRQYGANIAATWSAPGADKPIEEVNTAVQEAALELKRSALHDAQQLLADRNAKRAAYLAAERQLEDAPSADELAVALANAHEAVTSAEEQLAKLASKVQAKGGISGTCPHCAEPISYTQGAFHKGGTQAAPAEVDDHQRLTLALPGLRQAVTVAERQKARYGAIREAMPSVVTERDVTDAQAAVMAAAREEQDAANALRDASADAAQAAEARQKTEQAQLAHTQVTEWTKLESLMRPDGIPTTLLLRGLKPFNTRMAALAGEIGWPAPRLGADFVLRSRSTTTDGDLPYQLLSESEQWRVDALIAMAVSVHSGAKLLLLDRFDVLDNAGRNELLGWLGAAGKDVFDTVIVAGTLKDKPTVLAERFGVHVIWLDGSTAGTPPDADEEDEPTTTTEEPA